MIERIKLGSSLELSRIVHGHWRMYDWNYSAKELIHFIENIVDLGITSFDHADIYGNYSCESIFGKVLKQSSLLRQDIQLVTKCGIKLLSDKFPDRKIKYYDYSYEHIISSVEQSLRNFHTDYIDLLLLHRPSPIFNPKEINKAFNKLYTEGKVLNFGVSNFLPIQFEMLQANIDFALVTNQIEISPLYLEHFENSNINFLMKEKILPMAWSPLAGGKLNHPENTKEHNAFAALKEISTELDCSIEQASIAWLLNHPSQIIPILGSGKISRIQHLIKSLNVKISLEQWFKVYIASTGNELP